MVPCRHSPYQCRLSANNLDTFKGNMSQNILVDVRGSDSMATSNANKPVPSLSLPTPSPEASWKYPAPLFRVFDSTGNRCGQSSPHDKSAPFMRHLEPPLDGSAIRHPPSNAKLIAGNYCYLPPSFIWGKPFAWNTPSLVR